MSLQSRSSEPAGFVAPGTAPAAAVDRADVALYRAKHGGRNRVWADIEGTDTYAVRNLRSA
ncbi:hypothetical protein [Devosia sp.]|uniref:hypothetical protein n=1 Tax=Devosia sp. TaxID=1871048 RepID=UPI002FC9B619